MSTSGYDWQFHSSLTYAQFVQLRCTSKSIIAVIKCTCLTSTWSKEVQTKSGMFQNSFGHKFFMEATHMHLKRAKATHYFNQKALSGKTFNGRNKNRLTTLFKNNFSHLQRNKTVHISIFQTYCTVYSVENMTHYFVIQHSRTKPSSARKGLHYEKGGQILSLWADDTHSNIQTF